jgi:hypothetical protein
MFSNELTATEFSARTISFDCKLLDKRTKHIQGQALKWKPVFHAIFHNLYVCCNTKWSSRLPGFLMGDSLLGNGSAINNVLALTSLKHSGRSQLGRLAEEALFSSVNDKIATDAARD